MAFVMVLSWSRQVFLRFSLDARAASFAAGHVEAFAAFSGVARIVLYDNLKSAVLERRGQAIRFNPALLELAAHYHFEPRPVAVARGNEKGRVERAIGYIRTSFFAGRAFADLADLNAQADAWCGGLAAARPCPEDPSISVGEAFARERESLIGLPDAPWPSEERVEVKIGKTPYARFDLNDYSVPHAHVTKTLTVLASATTVRVLDGMEELARHARSWSRGEQIERDEHIADLVAAKGEAREHRGQNRLAHAAPSTTTLLEQAASRGTPIKSLVRELERLLEDYGATELERGCAEALEHGVPHSNAVRQALERRHEARGLPPSLPVRLTPSARARDVVVRTASLADYDRLTPDTDTDTDTGEHEHDDDTDA